MLILSVALAAFFVAGHCLTAGDSPQEVARGSVDRTLPPTSRQVLAPTPMAAARPSRPQVATNKSKPPEPDDQKYHRLLALAHEAISAIDFELPERYELRWVESDDTVLALYFEYFSPEGTPEDVRVQFNGHDVEGVWTPDSERHKDPWIDSPKNAQALSIMIAKATETIQRTWPPYIKDSEMRLGRRGTRLGVLFFNKHEDRILNSRTLTFDLETLSMLVDAQGNPQLFIEF